MSYLLVVTIPLIFLFRWSKLPDPTRRQQPLMLNSVPGRDSADTQSATAGKTKGVKLHPDQLGEPDEDGRIRIGVNNWLGPDPDIPGYVPCRIDLAHVAHPPRVVTYDRTRSASSRSYIR